MELLGGDTRSVDYSKAELFLILSAAMALNQ